MTPSIYIIADHFDGKVRPATFELAAFAQQLQEDQPFETSFVLLGDDIEGMADEISRTTGIDVLAFKISSLPSYNQEVYVKVLSQYFASRPFSYILAAQTTQGMDFTPALAVKLNAACLSSVEGAQKNTSPPSFKRSIFNGKVVSTITPEADAVILTILPGIIKVEGFDTTTPGKIEIEEITVHPEQIQNKGLVRARTDSQTVADANVIISAGRGIGKEENLDLIYRLAERFSRSAVGGPGPYVIWAGWDTNSKLASPD